MDAFEIDMYEQKSNQVIRRDATTILYKDRSSKVVLKAYKSIKKLPFILVNMCDIDYENEERRNKFIDSLITVIDYYFGGGDYLVKLENDKFLMNEFLKALLYYIKVEVCFNKNHESKILEFIKKKKYKNKEISEIIRSEIESINNSSFITPECYEYLKRSLSVHEDVMDSEVIRAVVMCTNKDLLIKSNLELLKSYKKEINYRFNVIDERKMSIDYNLYDLSIYDNKKMYLNLKKRAMALVLALITLGGVTLDGITIRNMFRGKPTVKYKTTYETYNSLGESKKGEKYLPVIGSENTHLYIYGEVYTENNALKREVLTYKVKDFDSTTNSLEEYFEINYDLLPDLLVDKKTVDASSDEIRSEYKVLSKYNQDVSDRITEYSEPDEDYTLFCILFIILEILVVKGALGIPSVGVFLSLRDDAIKQAKNCEKSITNIRELIKECLDYLNQNGLTLKEAIRLCDELEVLDSMSEEEKNLILGYKKLKEKNQDLLNYINSESEDKILKKYKEK